ncbi:MAG: hypothetical protein FGM54_03505 [Chitinophagaceae bacterium]|nr:hypothetical protein [Chitinophagaceae bacterium]
MQTISKLVFLAVVLIGFSTACVRERDTQIDMAKDVVIGDFVYSDAFLMACDASTKSSGETLANYKTTGYCAVLSHDTLSMPRQMVIDFGNVNCMCNDGRTRRGRILISYTGEHFADSGNVITFNFENYFVNNSHIMGEQTVVHQGANLLEQPYFNQTVSGKYLRADTSFKDTVRFNADRVITMVSGNGSPMWLDDAYEITGSASGRGMNNEYFAMNITKPLQRRVDCRYISGGKEDLQPQSKALRLMNYGEGDCDNQISIEINGKRYAFEL